MEDRETEEFVLVLERYFNQLVGGELPVEWKDRDPEPVERVPSYHGRHIVQDSTWNYCPATSPQKQIQQTESGNTPVRTIDLSIPPPPYILCEERRLSRSNSRDQFSIATSPSSVDHNMNEMQALVGSITSLSSCLSNNSPNKNSQNIIGQTHYDKNAIDPEDGVKDAKSIADVDFTSQDGVEVVTPQETRFPDKALLGKLDAPRLVLQQQRQLYDNASDIDLHSVMSIELLEEENALDKGRGESMTQRIEIKSNEIMNRVTEMKKIVNDAQLYLQSDDHRSDLGLKSNDSLLFIPRHDAAEEYNNLQGDPMPSESEAESTPTNSPTHVTLLSTEDTEIKKMCSSFGLHSRDIFISSLQQQQESDDIEELLRQLHTSTSLPFEENSLCLDPDIIDLTIIPPPSDDVDFCCVTPDAIDDKKSFLDQETGQRRDFYCTESDSSAVSQPDSDEIGIVFSAKPDDIGVTEAAEDDISAYIIPPPPPSSSRAVEEQNRVLARFRAAAEEIRRMMAHGNDNLAGSKYSDSMNSVSKFCTIPRRHEEAHRPPLSSITSLVTPVREMHAKICVSTNSQALPNGNGSNHGCAVDSETGVSWRPQPPPRVKRNSVASIEVGANHSVHKDVRITCHGDQSSMSHVVRDQTSQNASPSNGHLEKIVSVSQDSSINSQSTISNGYHYNGHPPPKTYLYNGYNGDNISNGHDGDFYGNGEYNGYESSEFQPSLQDGEGETCVRCKNGVVNGCVCKKVNRFLSYHQSLPRKSANLKLLPVNGSGLLENGLNSKVTFHSAQKDIVEMIDNLDLACRSRLHECSECLPKPQPGDTKLVKVRDTLIYESRQFVTASKLFVKSITESSDKMEENLTSCIALLDRMFAVSELVVMEMTLPSQINTLVEKLKEMAVAFSRTVQAASFVSTGETPDSNMTGLMHQATALANSLTVLMRTLRTFNSP